MWWQSCGAGKKRATATQREVTQGNAPFPVVRLDFNAVKSAVLPIFRVQAQRLIEQLR